MEESVKWFKPAQFHIHSGSIYKIADINVFDYGTYYCAIGDTKKSTIQVRKVILVKEHNTSLAGNPWDFISLMIIL